MKVRVPKTVFVTQKQIADELTRQFDEKSGELYDAVKDDIVAQLMATVLTCLHNDFGFDKDQLRQVKDGTEDLFVLMQNGGICGQEFNGLHCKAYMHDKFGIEWKDE
ncbi:MAG: hypothetical protein ACI4KD_05885 [Oscillospiraceae bacterium]